MTIHPPVPLRRSSIAGTAWGVLAATALLTSTAYAQFSVSALESLGLTDAEHTNNLEASRNFLTDFNAAGQALGFANRYNGGGADLGRSAWLFNGTSTIDLSISGDEFTRNDGYRFSSSNELNSAGQALGFAYRYNGEGSDLGLSAWLFNGTTTTEIGLTGNEFTRNDGYRLNEAGGLNEAGQVAGNAWRYNGGGANLGGSAWLYTGTSTVDISLTGNEFSSTNGYRLSGVRDLNEAGQVVGYAWRYNGRSDQFGESAWLYTGTATIDISPTGNEFIRYDGFRYSDARQLNEAGEVVGSALRFNAGGTQSGQSVWLYNGTSTTDLSRTGTEFTSNNDYRSSFALWFNEAGQVVGGADRYSGGSTYLGLSAWLFNGTSTIDLSRTGDEFTSSEGYRFTAPRSLNAAGQVAGVAQRYKGGATQLGVSAWLYDGTSTIDLSLTGNEFTREDGYRASFDHQLNAAGQVVGGAERYNGGNVFLGQAAWLYNGTATIDLSLSGNEFTRNDGYRTSVATQLNAAGLVAGYAERYGGGATVLGQSAWLFDSTASPGAGQTVFFFGETSSGFASSEISFLSDSGIALGSYLDPVSNLTRAFAWLQGEGTYDLTALIDPALLAATDLNGLNTARGLVELESGLLSIFGGATTSDGGLGVYRLTLVAIPEPAQYAVMFSGVSVLFACACRRKRRGAAGRGAA